VFGDEFLLTRIYYCRLLLRVLLHQLTRPEGSVRALVLSVLAEMFRKPSMGACFHNYIELLILKVLECHKDNSKEVHTAVTSK